jgi:hypothetical protein
VSPPGGDLRSHAIPFLPPRNGGSGEAELAQWIANLDEVAELNPAIVVAGHKKVDNGDDPKIIEESQQYLRDFSRITAEESTAAAIVARMIEICPDWGNLHTIWYSARVAIGRKHS